MLQALDISFYYGKKCILNNISLQADRGMCIGIFGTNGCGKSTLLKVLSGVLTPRQGEIYFNGKKADKKNGVFFQYAGYVPQDNPLMEDLTVLDNLKLWYTHSKSNLQAELNHGVLRMLHLHTMLKTKVSALSGGMKKRLSIGLALAGQPLVLILDEPTAALDLPCKEDIRSHLKLFMKHGGTVILATHEEPDFELCDKRYLLKNGSLTKIESGIPNQQIGALLRDDTDDI